MLTTFLRLRKFVVVIDYVDAMAQRSQPWSVAVALAVGGSMIPHMTNIYKC